MNISFRANLGMSVQAVWTHRFRSLLTILGIVIGITTVVTVASLLTGLRQGVVTFFQELGPDNIFVYRTSGDPSMPAPIKERKRRALKPEYAENVKRWSTALADVGLDLYIPAVVDGNPITARVPGFESENIAVTGLSPNMAEISPRDLDSGRFFTAEENQRGAHVAVIGASVSEALFPRGNPLGRTMMVDGAEYTVIGVYAKAKGGFFGENGMDNAVDIPLRTAQVRYPQVETLHGGRQGPARPAPGGLRRSGGSHAPHTAPGHGRTRTISPFPRRTRSFSSSTASPASSAWWPSRFPAWGCWWAASA